MIVNLLLAASLLSPLAFWFAAPRRVPVTVAQRRKSKAGRY